MKCPICGSGKYFNFYYEKSQDVYRECMMCGHKEEHIPVKEKWVEMRFDNDGNYIVTYSDK